MATHKITFIAGAGSSIESMDFTPGSSVILPSAIKNSLVPSQYEFIGWTDTNGPVAETSTRPANIYEAGSEYTPNGNEIKLYAVYCAQQDEWVEATNEEKLIDGDYVIFWEYTRNTAVYFGWTPVPKNLTDSTNSEIPGWAYGSYDKKILVMFKRIGGINNDDNFLDYPDGLASLYHIEKIGNRQSQEYLISVNGASATYYFRNYASDVFGVGFINESQKPRGWTLAYQTVRNKTSRYFISVEYNNRLLSVNDNQRALIVPTSRSIGEWYVQNPIMHLYRKPFVKYATYPEDINNPDKIYVTIKNYQWASLEEPTSTNDYHEIASDEYPDVYAKGSNVTVSKTIDNNYEFIKLKVNGNDENYTVNDNEYSYCITDIQSNTTVEWYIKRKKGTFTVKNANSEQGTITISIANNGTAILGSDDKYTCTALYGSAVTLKGTPINSSWTFLGFTVDDGTEYIKKFTFDGASHEYKPHFVNKCTIKCNIQNYHGIAVGSVSLNNSSNTIMVDPGESCLLNAKANNGFIFKNWTKNVSDDWPEGFDEHKAKQTINPTGSITFTAHFDRFALPIIQTNQHKVNYYPSGKTQLFEDRVYDIMLNYKGQTITLHWPVRIIPLISRSFSSTGWWDKDGNSFTLQD